MKINVRKFISKYIDCKVTYNYWFAMAAAYKDTIFINPKEFKRQSLIKQKSILLHEIGHLVCRHHNKPKRARKLGYHEYEAQKWAYYNTNNIRIKKDIVQRLIYWTTLDDFSREYRNAGRIYLRKGI